MPVSISDLSDSAKSYVKERTSALFISIISVWMVRNWPIVYSFFFFDSETKLAARITYFQNYWQKHSFLCELLYSLLIGLFVFMLSQMLSLLGKAIMKLVSDKITPEVLKKVPGSQLVEREKYLSLQDRNNTLEQDLEALREKVVHLIRENEKQIAQYNANLESKMNEVYNRSIVFVRTLNELYVPDVKDFFKHFSESTYYAPKPLLETLVSKGFIIPTKVQEADGYTTYMISQHGARFRKVLEDLHGI